MDNIGLTGEVAVDICKIAVELSAVLGELRGIENMKCAGFEFGYDLVELIDSALSCDILVHTTDNNRVCGNGSAPVGIYLVAAYNGLDDVLEIREPSL